MSPQWTRVLRYARLGVSLALLAVVLRSVALEELVDAFRRGSSRWYLLVAAAALPAGGLVIAGARWKILLARQGARAPLRTYVLGHVIAAFFNQFLPSTVGGDLARGWWVAPLVRSRTVSLAVVALDRVIGFAGICAVALLAAAGAPVLVAETPEFWVAITAAVLGLGLGGALATGRVRIPVAWLRALPYADRVQTKGSRVIRALRMYKGETWRLSYALMLSMLLQLAIVCQYWIIARAFGLDIALWTFAVVIPIVTVITLIPITINGLGLREGSLVLLGAGLGLGASDAVAIAWFVTVTVIMYAALGGVAYLVVQPQVSPAGNASPPVQR